MTAFSYPNPIVSLNGMAVNGRQQFTRDQSIPVSVTFYDGTGAVVTPSSATLTLSFLQNNCRTKLDYTLVQSGNVWSYTWDSTVANRCEVFGHIATSAPIYSTDFSFQLVANKANREEAGDDEPDDGYSR